MTNATVYLSLCLQELEEVDEKLQKFCTTFQDLYGREHCTPNMHMYLHLKQSILNNGPVYIGVSLLNVLMEFWEACKNWASPELQMLKKFLTYQDLLLLCY